MFWIKSWKKATRMCPAKNASAVRTESASGPGTATITDLGTTGAATAITAVIGSVIAIAIVIVIVRIPETETGVLVSTATGRASIRGSVIAVQTSTGAVRGRGSGGTGIIVIVRIIVIVTVIRITDTVERISTGMSVEAAADVAV